MKWGGDDKASRGMFINPSAGWQWPDMSVTLRIGPAFAQ